MDFNFTDLNETYSKPKGKFTIEIDGLHVSTEIKEANTYALLLAADALASVYVKEVQDETKIDFYRTAYLLSTYAVEKE